MSLIATDSGGNFELIPAGVYPAVCLCVIDLGTQVNARFGKEQKKIQMMWEIPDEKMQSGDPFVISNRYTASTNEKSTLTEHLQAWRGKPFTPEERKGFDLRKVLGVPCLLTIVHQPSQDGTKTFANVAAISGLPKSMPIPQLTQPTYFFSIDEWDQTVFDEFLSEKMQNTIKESKEYKEKFLGAAAANSKVPAGASADIDENQIPFAPAFSPCMI